VSNDNAQLIGIHKARYYARKDGLALGPGAFVAALEYSTGKCASIVGKPSADFFLNAIAEWTSIQPHECVMIGDVSDI
jgi:ribonucleotide monophosphatase NagD (HAD superfamily)